MIKKTIRLNITLPQDLVALLDKVAGNRKRSQFIADAVKQKIEQVRKEEMEMLLEEGYTTHRMESVAITKDFDGASDLEKPADENQ